MSVVPKPQKKGDPLSRITFLIRENIGWLAQHKTLLSFIAFILQRLAFGVVVILFIIFFSYFGLEMASGTPFTPAFRQAIPSTIAYIQNLLHGDLGYTNIGGEILKPVPVSTVIAERLPRSLGLLTIALLIASFAGIILGTISARSRPQGSLFILILTLIGISIPSFFAAFLLQWFFTSITRNFGHALLPVGGFGWDAHLILPALVLAARPLAQITRMTFIAIRGIYSQDFIRTAFSKGLHRYYVFFAHVFRNAAIPILTTIGISLRFSLSSLPVVELYFGWPGAGVTLLKAIANQDMYLTIGLTVCLGAFFILVNLLLDISFRIIDPRLLTKPDHITASRRSSIISTIKSIPASIRDWFARLIHRNKPDTELQPLFSADDLDSSNGGLDTDFSARTASAWKSMLTNFPFIVGGLVVAGLLLIVIFGPKLTPNDPFSTQGLVTIDGQLTPPPFPPSEGFPWGTDALGRGILSLIISGAQITLTLAILAVAARMLIGVFAGSIAGWANGSLADRLISGFAEVIAAFPALLATMIIILAIGIRQGMQPFIIALCFVGWGEIMQFVRSEVTTIRPKQYIEAAVAVGAGTPRLLSKHVLPNLFASLIALAALEMGSVLMLLGELGFIAIFIGGGTLIELPIMTMHYSDIPEWGALLSNIRYQARSYPWTGLYPMLAFFIAILSFNLLGEGIRRLVEQGNPLLNKIVNRYTVLVVLLAVFGYNYVSNNSGAIPFYRQHAQEFSLSNTMQHIDLLTHARMFGRALGTDGMHLAAFYNALEFEKYGVQPGGSRRSYFQERERAFEELDDLPQLKIFDEGPAPTYRIDFAAYPGRNVTAGQAIGPVRFISLGEDAMMQSPGWTGYYPDLGRADYSTEILLTLSDREASFLTIPPKAGLLVVTENPELLAKRFTLSGRTGLGLDFNTGGRHGTEKPYMWISEELANRILAPDGYTVDQLKVMAGDHAFEQIFDIPLQSKVAMNVNGTLVEDWPIFNILGLIPGTEGYDLCEVCLGKRLIVVLVPYDSPPVGPEGVYQHAIDNASGNAIMLEAMRVLQETDYQPLKSLLFVAYSGEGLDGGNSVAEPDINMFLQASPSFLKFQLEAIIQLRGLGGGSGDRLIISAEGSTRLANVAEKAARQVGARVKRADENIDIGLIYDEGSNFLESGQDAPILRMYWEGWDEYARLPEDTRARLSPQAIEDAGKTLAMTLMILGRETNY